MNLEKERIHCRRRLQYNICMLMKPNRNIDSIWGISFKSTLETWLTLQNKITHAWIIYSVRRKLHANCIFFCWLTYFDWFLVTYFSKIRSIARNMNHGKNNSSWMRKRGFTDRDKNLSARTQKTLVVLAPTCGSDWSAHGSSHVVRAVKGCRVEWNNCPMLSRTDLYTDRSWCVKHNTSFNQK